MQMKHVLIFLFLMLLTLGCVSAENQTDEVDNSALHVLQDDFDDTVIGFESETVFTKNSSKEDVKEFENIRKNNKLSLNPISDIKIGENISVSGKYEDIEGNAIANSILDLRFYSLPYGSKKLESSVINNTTTNDEGIYNFTFTPGIAGKLFVEVDAKGIENSYAKNSTSIYVWPKNTTVTLSNITFDTDNVVLKGMLIDEDKNVLRYTSVGVLLGQYVYGDYDENRNLKYTNISKSYIRTDKNGFYTFNYKPTNGGRLNISLYYPGYGNYRFTETILMPYILPKSTVVSLDTLPSRIENYDSFNISGKLTDIDGKVLKYTTIGILVGKTPYDDLINNYISKEYVRTDQYGNFKYQVCPQNAGDLYITVYYPGYRYYRFNHTDAHVKITGDLFVEFDLIDDIKLGEGITLKGKLLFENGDVLSNENVHAHCSPDRGYYYSSAYGEATTNSNGEFVILWLEETFDNKTTYYKEPSILFYPPKIGDYEYIITAEKYSVYYSNGFPSFKVSY